MNLGLVGISNNKKKSAVIPALIRFFTKSQWTHSFLTIDTLYGNDAVFEAGMTVQIVPYDRNYVNDPDQSYRIYRLILAQKDDLERALSLCFSRFSGVNYGYFQLLWFVYRWFAGLFRYDVRHNRNWFSDGVICSELVYRFLEEVGGEYKAILADFNADTIQSQDILDIIESRPDLFALTVSKS